MPHVLIQLESKLKEVREKKKSKKERVSNNNGNGEGPKCDTLPKNMEINYKASGISGVGDLDLSLKFGIHGNYSFWDFIQP